MCGGRNGTFVDSDRGDARPRAMRLHAPRGRARGEATASAAEEVECVEEIFGSHEGAAANRPRARGRCRSRHRTGGECRWGDVEGLIRLSGSDRQARCDDGTGPALTAARPAGVAGTRIIRRRVFESWPGRVREVVRNTSARKGVGNARERACGRTLPASDDTIRDEAGAEPRPGCVNGDEVSEEQRSHHPVPLRRGATPLVRASQASVCRKSMDFRTVGVGAASNASAPRPVTGTRSCLRVPSGGRRA